MARVYLDERTGFWVVDYKDAQGRRKRVKGGRIKSLADATLRKILDEIQQEVILGSKKPIRIKFEDFAREYLENYSKVNKRSWYRDRSSIIHLAKAFSGKHLHEIFSKEIERYKAERSSSGEVAKATINRELALLKHMFTIAIQWGNAKENPVKQVKLFKEDNQRTRYLEPKELRLLYAHCPKHIRSFVKVAANTGMRLSELFNLKWCDVSFDHGVITVRNSKSGYSREISMNNIVREALSGISKYFSSPHVFCKPDGKPRRSIKTAFERAVKDAGFDDVTFHTLRHTYASHLVMAGVDIKTVQELMGHRSIQMTLRYSHLSQAHKKEAAFKLEKYQFQKRDGTNMAQAGLFKAEKSHNSLVVNE